ncbi:MAG: GTP-binding protein [Thermoplasmata archaeon]|nr:MAG: GTP-binding protein [Thermoplasmata archaeon]
MEDSSTCKLYKLKICLVGEKAVGKTSLVRKYVFNEYDNNYLVTIGTKVTKKELKIKDPKNDELVDVQLYIWDIVGQKGFRQLLQDAYFFGAQGIIGVCDNTREITLLDLDSWMDTIHGVIEDVPTVFLGNKCDLKDRQQIGLNEITSVASGYEKSASYISSAKTGFNVELAFETLSKKILKNML